MIRSMVQLIRTAALIKKLTAAGMFREVRITMGARGLESRLFVEYAGKLSIVTANVSHGLAEAQLKMIESKEKK